MNDFLFFLTSGLCIGAIYALIALGYTLVYGIIKLINFAHGEFYMVGAYAGFGIYLMLPSTLPVYITLPIIILISAVAGILIAVITEQVAYRPIRKSGRLAALLTAIGVSFFLQNMASFINKANPLQYSSDKAGSLGEICQRSVNIGGGGIKIIQFVYIPVTIILTLMLWYIIMKTKFGRAMRAVSQDADAAALMGINVDSVIRKAFMLGGFMAGIAGTLVGVQSLIEPMMGFMPGLKAFIAAVLGGIGSIPGAVIGGFLIGVIENMVVWCGIPSGYKDIAAFFVLILVLIVKPQGILGKTAREKV
ncbi:MAG: branched-chain amino acid ABC transporter permease [Lentisphaerae bacterium]|nr:branched-chain amino acid ABC transporter permease [Lentisphaerota bacterium]